jgi:hypothetical protein
MWSRPFAILNIVGGIWLVLGILTATFGWAWAGDASLVANWMGVFDVVKIMVAANLVLALLVGLVGLVRRLA